jgi:hypothetical protein
MLGASVSAYPVNERADIAAVQISKEIDDMIAQATAKIRMLITVFEALARGASAAKKSSLIRVTLSHSPGISLNGCGDVSVGGAGNAGEGA